MDSSGPSTGRGRSDISALFTSTRSASLPYFWLAAGVAQLVGLILYGIYRGYTARQKFKKLEAQGVPLIRHSWLWGHLPILLRWRREQPPDTHFLYLAEYLRQNLERFFPDHPKPPPVVYLDLWPLNLPLMVVLDYKLSVQFMQDHNLPKHRNTAKLVQFFTEGKDLVSSNGEYWKTWRTLLNPGFSTRNLLALVPKMLEEVDVFTEILDRGSGAEGQWGPVFSLRDAAVDLTFDVIGRVILDEGLHDQSGVHSVFRKAFTAQDSQLTFGQFDPLFFLQPLNFKRKNDIARNDRILRDFFTPKIESRIHRLDTDTHDDEKPAGPPTVVDHALYSLLNGKEKSPFSRSEITHELIQHLKMFWYAGYDTTATTLSYILYRLSSNPAALARLRAEHDSVFGTDPVTTRHRLREIPHSLNALPYTLAVIKETLRVDAPASTIREGKAGFSLHGDNGTEFPTEGCMVWDAVIAIHHDEKVWPRAEEFLPERWLAKDGDELYPPKNAWRPFSQGIRNCIGQELAVLELKLAVVLIAREFELRAGWEEWDRLHPGPKHAINNERLYPVGLITGKPKDGFPVCVRRVQRRQA